MNKLLPYLLLPYLLLSFLWVACCSVHEFPPSEAVDPALVETQITLTLGVDVVMPSDIQSRVEEPVSLDNHDVRYTADLYAYPANRQTDLGPRVARIVHTEPQMNPRQSVALPCLKLKADDYLVLVWVDWVAKGTAEDLHYDTRDLTAVKKQSANGFHPAKDAFCANALLPLAQYRGRSFARHNLLCALTRPFAVYEVIATDVDKYIGLFPTPTSYASLRPEVTKLAYRLYLPQGYNVRTEMPQALTPGVGYTLRTIDSLDQNKVVLASDYVFVGPDAYFTVDFWVDNVPGDRVGRIDDLKLNLRRNRKTLVYGEFLTKSVRKDDGLGIDDRFTNELIVSI